MKQLTILSGRCLVVELPEGAKVEIGSSGAMINGRFVNDCLCVYRPQEDRTSVLRLPPGNWRIIGMLSEVTEEQAKGMVDYFTTDEDFGK